MKFSAKEQYGLRVMAELARKRGRGPTPLNQIAEVEGLPLPSLEQIVIPLRQAGLVQSLRGAHGGYLLGRRPEAITIGDIIRALEGTIVPIPCVAKDSCTPCGREDVCVARNVWERVRDRLEDTLDKMTLADLC